MGQDADQGKSPGDDLVYAAAGLVDVAVSLTQGAIERLGTVLRRSDLPELSREGREDLRARGELALRRYAGTAESHLEALARQTAAGKSPDNA